MTFSSCRIDIGVRKSARTRGGLRLTTKIAPRIFTPLRRSTIGGSVSLPSPLFMSILTCSIENRSAVPHFEGHASIRREPCILTEDSITHCEG
uniref:Uncharacterized protein n=1 Tax=Ascaris lumbricoides TaxID=6252 RepID=A0A0M3HEU9_ASCLU